MAISTYKVFLMHSESGTTYTKLADIKDFPDLFGEPNTIETTTLSDGMQTFIAGIKQSDMLSFTMNYDKTIFGTLKALEGETEHFAVWFGGTVSGNTVTPTGSDGKFTFDGQLSMGINGGGVDEVIEMVANIVPTTEVVVAS